MRIIHARIIITIKFPSCEYLIYLGIHSSVIEPDIQYEHIYALPI